MNNPIEIQARLTRGEDMEVIRAELRENNRRASARINSWFHNLANDRNAFTGEPDAEEKETDDEAVS